MMTITLSLPTETSQKLQARAAETGKDVATLIREAVDKKLSVPEDLSDPSGLPYAQWKPRFDTRVGGRPAAAHFIDDSRESIYAGRGE
jgi:hypothetical protein